MKILDKKFKTAEKIATLFSIGNIKYCPGTFGSIATFPLFLILNYIFIGFGMSSLSQLVLSYVLTLVILIYVAFWSINIYIGKNKKSDPSEVVIDEVVGQMIAYMMPTLLTMYYFMYFIRGLLFDSLVSTIITVIILICPLMFFRVFDILKPGLVGYCDTKMVGAKGIIMDDIIAGVYAGLVVCLILSMFFLGLGLFCCDFLI